ncbi:hypothetical protein HMPREF0208_00356 [Citrobacter koseri]|nr:hypothetical protein HMPREF3220_01173 [Citrobacter koseri]KXA06257.1 hypothetical protein HMPREF3207_00406 [Citrobacter koseri]KXB47020.1 hypothetical protein HMPREF0208_00356 [Citrobacter koseri]
MPDGANAYSAYEQVAYVGPISAAPSGIFYFILSFSSFSLR